MENLKFEDIILFIAFPNRHWKEDLCFLWQWTFVIVTTLTDWNKKQFLIFLSSRLHKMVNATMVFEWRIFIFCNFKNQNHFKFSIACCFDLSCANMGCRNCYKCIRSTMRIAFSNHSFRENVCILYIL